MLQLYYKHHGALFRAREQLNSIHCAENLYHKCKKVSNAEERVMCVCAQKLDLVHNVSFKDPTSLEMDYTGYTW